MLHEKSEIITYTDMLVTFHNAVNCSLIMFGFVCWGGNISEFDKGGWKRLSKNKTKQKKKPPKTPDHVVGKPLDSF